MKQEEFWDTIGEKNKIVVKIGSSSLTYKNTRKINLQKIEKLVRNLCDLKNSGKQVILVSSGAVAVGRETLGIINKPKTTAQKQACAAVGQSMLMMHYQKLFSEYGQTTAQVLMTRENLKRQSDYQNLKNTFTTLLEMNVIPIVNENDTIATEEIEFGDNDTLSAIVTAITKAELLILLTDTNGLFTDDPSKNPDAKLIEMVPDDRKELYQMAKRTSDNDVGTGGMYTKVLAGKIANRAGADMIIASAENVGIIEKIMQGQKNGTLFPAKKKENFDIRDYLEKEINE